MSSNKTIYDLVPVIAFFLSYLFGDIYLATAVLMISCPLQVLTYRYFNGVFDKAQVITLGVVEAAGSATLIFHNPLFIQWKITIIYWVFALALLGSHVIGKKTIMERMLINKLHAPVNILRRANFSWGLFFIWFGCLNLYIVYHYSEKIWVYFKMFGATGVLLIASIIFAVYLSKHIKEK